MAKLIVLVVSIVLGGGAAVLIAGTIASLVVVGFIALVLTRRRAWIPRAYNLRSLWARRVTSSMTVGGATLVVFIFTAVLMLANGIHHTLATTGSANNAKILRKGSRAEMLCAVPPEVVHKLGTFPELARLADGTRAISPEVVVLVSAGKTAAGDDRNVTMRGVSASALELHDVRVAGRLFRPGTSEVVIGSGVRGRYPGAVVGQAMRLGSREWTVVGVIDAGGGAYDSEIWGDADQLLDAFKRRPLYSTVTLRLQEAGALAAVQARMAADPELSGYEARDEREYWASQSEFGSLIEVLGLAIAIVFAFVAVLTGMVTLSSHVAARASEIGVLRVLGYRRGAVLMSIIGEGVMVGVVACAVGIPLAGLLQMTRFSMVNFQTTSEMTFRFHMSGATVLAATLFALLIGYLGGLLPAWRASRIPLAEAAKRK